VDVLEVLDGGLLTTVQDAGRLGHEAEGVPRSGAADEVGLAVANLLLGNEPDVAALECTLVGPRLRALVEVDVAIGGADLGAVLETDGSATPVAPGSSVRLPRGAVLAFAGPRDEPGSGCRAYLAVPGGIDVPVILDSRSTCLPAGFGGLEGRALRAGDRVAVRSASVGRAAPSRRSARLSAKRAAELPSVAQRLRVMPGPAARAGDASLEAVAGRAWTVSHDSDRRGLRLQGVTAAAPSSPAEAVPALASPSSGELPSHGVLPGAIQVTPSGEPLVLMQDAGTTGGYPVPAVVIRADLSILGQLAPGDEVRFRVVTADEARDALLDRRRLLRDLRADLS